MAEGGPGFVTPEKGVSEVDVSVSLAALGIEEGDDVRSGFERLIPWNGDFYGRHELRDYRQVFTFDSAGYVMSPSEEYLNHLDRAILAQIEYSPLFHNLPVGCLRRSDTFGSTFAVAPHLERVSRLNRDAPGGKKFQWQLSAGHNTHRILEATESGVWSDSVQSGLFISRRSGMKYEIVVHGEQDKNKYDLEDKTVRSPPASPDKAANPDYGTRYHDPKIGKVYLEHADMMLLLVEVDPQLTSSAAAKRFYVPSGTRPSEMEDMEPIYVAGTPGEVAPHQVPMCLGQTVPVEHQAAFANAINRHLIKPNIRGISFGHKIVTNGRQDKHTASSWKGMSGCVCGNLHHPGCFEGVHISGTVDAQERVFNRAVSKDDPFLVCTYVDYVLPDLARFTEWQYAGQEASLRTWLANHKQLLEEKDLWQNVVAAGFE